MSLSEAQLAVRATGLGGTCMTAICGENPYRSAIDVWLEKRHGLGLEIPVEPPEPFDGNERTTWGSILEPVLADRYASDTGLTLVDPQTTFRHPDREWQIGTPDRLCSGEDLEGKTLSVLEAWTRTPMTIKNVGRIWEGKTHGMFGGKAYDLVNLEVPPDKRIQVAHYQALTGCKDADLSALFDTHLYRVFHIPHDQEVEDYLLEEGELFWTKVIEGEQPEPDGSDSFNKYLAQRFKLHTADMEECPVSLYKEIVEYRLQRESKKAAEREMKLIAQRIQEAIGPGAGFIGTNGKPAVTWKRKKVGEISWSKVAKNLRDRFGMTDDEFDEVVAEFTGDPSRLFLVK